MPRSQAAETPVQLTMQLDWKFNVQFAGLLLADHLGLYRQQGLDVVIKPWESGMVVPEEVAKTPMMIGCSEQNLILDAQAQGESLKAIATMMQASPYALMTLPESGLTTLADLRGKKVGVHVDGIKVLQLAEGVTGIEDIEVVEIPYDNKADRLISGEFAAVQCYAVDEPIAFAQKVGQPPIIIPLDQYGYDAYAQVFFTSSDLLATHPDQISAFLAASFQGWQMALADIPATAKLIAETYAEPDSKYTNVEYQQKSLELVADYILRGISEAEIGQISADRWQETADLMLQYGIIQQLPDPQASLDLSFWPANG